MDFILTVQEKILNLFYSKENIAKKINGIYSCIPFNANPPYIHIVGINAKITNLNFCTRYDCNLHIKTVNDQYSGRVCYELLHLIKLELESYAIDIPKYEISNFKVTNISVEQNPSCLLWAGDLFAKNVAFHEEDNGRIY